MIHGRADLSDGHPIPARIAAAATTIARIERKQVPLRLITFIRHRFILENKCFSRTTAVTRVEVPHRVLVKGQTLKPTKLVSRGRFAQLVQIVNARVGQGTLLKTKRSKN